jgi:hypothetical protein
MPRVSFIEGYMITTYLIYFFDTTIAPIDHFRSYGLKPFLAARLSLAAVRRLILVIQSTHDTTPLRSRALTKSHAQQHPHAHSQRTA